MNSLDALKDHSRHLNDRFSGTKHWEISKTVLYMSAAVYLLAQVIILLRRDDCSSHVLTELHRTTDRLHVVESSLEVLQKTVVQLLSEKHERAKRMVPDLRPVRLKRKMKRRRRIRSFRREIRVLRRKMKVFEKR